MRGDLIAAIGPAAETEIPPGAGVVEGAGKYLLPGFIETHAHVSKTRASALGFGDSGHGWTRMGTDCLAHRWTRMDTDRATRRWARFLRLGDSVGTIERGKIADLVLLEANPLDDVRKTPRIAAVVLRGTLSDVRQQSSRSWLTLFASNGRRTDDPLHP